MLVILPFLADIAGFSSPAASSAITDEVAKRPAHNNEKTTAIALRISHPS
jgi:hypothetical protein